jgi:hypothetical protein
MRDPEFGYCDVTCSRVMALEQQPPKMSESVGSHIVVGEKGTTPAGFEPAPSTRNRYTSTIFLTF